MFINKMRAKAELKKRERETERKKAYDRWRKLTKMVKIGWIFGELIKMVKIGWIFIMTGKLIGQGGNVY